MKKKIVLSLLTLFLFFAIGIVFSTLYIQHTTAALEKLIKLHQIEDLRQHLILSIQTVQSELYTVGTPLGHKLDMITDNVSLLEETAAKCTGCHHEPEIDKKLRENQKYIQDYQEALSYYITASANKESIDRLKLAAAGIGNTLLAATEKMSLDASRKLSLMTSDALERARIVRLALIITIFFTFIFSLLIAFRLTKSITHPIDVLVTATRAIASGNLDHQVSYQDKTEFGELAENFNIMSSALKDGYTQLEEDIAERKKAEEALRESEERYVLAARGANDGLWDWNLKDNNVYYSVRWKSMLGYEDNEVGNDPEAWFRLLHDEDREKVASKIHAYLRQGDQPFEIEYRIMHKDGTCLWMLCRGLAVRDQDGQVSRMAGSQTDITSRKLAEEQLVHDAFHDALTGLPNRALFRDRLLHAINSSRRMNSYLYAVMFLDVDRFKIVNDSLGHGVGDELLVEISRRLTNCLRPGDTVARLGGDEFAVLLENITDHRDAADVAERIQEEFAPSFLVKGHEIYVTQSIGIVLRTSRYEHPEQVLSDADIAMYEAKAKGKARYVFFEEDMHTSIAERLELEADLRIAVEHHNDFVLHYQPIINVSTHKLEGFEALVRWNHPKKGLLSPLIFIPLAEETGMIHALGEWVLRESCVQLKKWQLQYTSSVRPLRMSANVSGKQFLRDGFAELLISILTELELAPHTLAIEITESIIMEDLDLAVATMKRLRDHGVQIHIDDFGTGYSSLSYLHRFPVTALKIDRSFIHKMSANEENREIVRTIIALAQNLNLHVIAEGVEIDTQLSDIKGMDCQFAQGFYFARPMAALDIDAWIKKKDNLSITA